jgi:hypothetical protein
MPLLEMQFANWQSVSLQALQGDYHDISRNEKNSGFNFVHSNEFLIVWVRSQSRKNID